MEIWMLIAIAILEVVDGRGLALRLVRLLPFLFGGETNVEKTTDTETKK